MPSKRYADKVARMMASRKRKSRGRRGKGMRGRAMRLAKGALKGGLAEAVRGMFKGRKGKGTKGGGDTRAMRTALKLSRFL